MKDDFHVKNVTNQDTKAIELAYSALKEYAHYLTCSLNQEEIIQRMLEFYNSKIINQLHKSNFIFLYFKEDLVGVSTAYAGNLIPYYNKNITDIIKTFDAPLELKNQVINNLPNLREANDHEYYIDTLAIDSNFQGKGLLQKLLKANAKKAKAENFNNLTLLVEQSKEYLVDVYKKYNFEYLEDVTLDSNHYKKFIQYI